MTRSFALERRFRASGAPEDEAVWLAARVRAGELTPPRLELAAWCGHAAAALGQPLDRLEIDAEWLTFGPQGEEVWPDDPRYGDPVGKRVVARRAQISS